MDRSLGFATALIVASMLHVPTTSAQDFDPENWGVSRVVSSRRQTEDAVFTQTDWMSATEKSTDGAGCISGSRQTSSCRSGFYAGFELLFLKPHFKDNIAFFLQDANFVNTVQTFDYDYETAPRFWLGFKTDEGLGLRGSYFEFDDSSRRFDIIPPGAPLAGFSPVLDPEWSFTFINFAAGDEVATSHSLELNSFDLELTQSAVVGVWHLQGGLGVRYSAIAQKYRLTRNPTNDVMASESRFEGLGPTISLEGERPLWCGLAIFSRARGSLLFGNEHARMFDSNAIFTTVRDADELLTTAEIQIGLEWTTETRFGETFVRGTWQGQVWNGARSLTGTDEYVALMGFGIALGVTR